MSTVQSISKAKTTGKSTGTVHRESTNSSTHNRGMSPASTGPLSAFYSAGPVLSLGPPVQPKLTIGKPNDRYEREADRVADQVMRMPEGSLVNSHWSLGKREKESPLVQRESTCPECPEKDEIQTKPIAEQITPLVQRQVVPEEEEENIEPGEAVQGQFIQKQEEEQEEEEPIPPVQEMAIQRQEEEEEEPDPGMSLQRQEVEPEEEYEKEPVNLQAKANTGSTPKITPSIASGIRSLKGGGQPLTKSVRNYFEPRFGRDFSQVRVHMDSKAAETAKSINAKAFTTGKDVVFGARQYSPETFSGNRLIAHELTHVVQQDAHIKNLTEYSPKYQREAISISAPDARRQVQATRSVVSNKIQRSTLSDELEQLWDEKRKKAFFDLLRSGIVFDPDVDYFIESELKGDEKWLARNLVIYGPEKLWPIHKRVKREMKKLDDAGGKDAVFEILRDAHGIYVGDPLLAETLSEIFADNRRDLWLAENLVVYGFEENWPNDLREMLTRWPEGETAPIEAEPAVHYGIIPIGEFIRHVQVIEKSFPEKSPQEILSLIRNLYYGSYAGSPNFDRLIPDAPNTGAVKTCTDSEGSFCESEVGNCTCVYAHGIAMETIDLKKAVSRLREHADENEERDNPSPYIKVGSDLIDVGHLLVGVDAILHPRAGWTFRRVGLPEAPGIATWVGDLGAAMVWLNEHIETGQPSPDVKGYQFKLPSENVEDYYQNSLPRSDLLGDVDAYGMEQLMGPMPLSDVLTYYYVSESGGEPRYRFNRWQNFCLVNGLTYLQDGTRITWTDFAKESVIRQIKAFADVFSLRKGLIDIPMAVIRGSVPRRSWSKAPEFAERFLSDVKAGLEEELTRQTMD